jgi:hypothetical protein
VVAVFDVGVVLPPDVVPVGLLLPVLPDVAELVEVFEENGFGLGLG